MPDVDTREPLPKYINDKLDQALLEKRRIFLSDQVDSESAKDIIRKLWYLDHQNPGKPILFIINSPGGSVDSGFAIWDQIKLLSSPVVTLVTGLAASMGSLLSLVSGKGRRFATKNARIMIHQPLIGGLIRGQATDLEIQAKEMLKTRDQIADIYVEATGRTRKEIEKAIDRDNWMTAEEAKTFGLIDRIITSMKDVEAFLS
ncbi:MAG: ATP-dependent Clp protease proteolytic subunit [uncultured bacterium]|nr:MAG: ATP-dependent Clp protease proteolytic subunit [uncultured bacterium]OGN55258.1 MAG: ATP-dependent Clp protease proteolytic subunit [Chlamydiae bacterium RIFCSPHIGHO2_01_FULL_44_39]OGN59773.1 MAG: ATP-dependent Clp protease proteolytic subunit [Chlamydiae bacterium RIFCSPHIGHO2_12_FULL_44_59]OGN65871.1 MAG: ATP-dependent Clp protease proteolytic subunit [Chlamydiae bacterium RIFCSPLOWO2_01_FULL_44_52]OGN68281.1 MAG: ATP-dependent Clp protease proteolytic subunit [Chlamydiae bacterium RI